MPILFFRTDPGKVSILLGAKREEKALTEKFPLFEST